MKKKNKSVEDDWSTGWRCGDCNAWNTKKDDYCNAPQHEFAERAIHAEYLYGKLAREKEEAQQERFEMTPKQFSAEVADMLAEYLDKQYADGKVGQYDLVTASMAFFESLWIIIGNGYEKKTIY